MATKQLSYPKDKIKVLLLEGVHPATVERFREAGYEAESIKPALSESDLQKAIRDVHILGIRSKTQVSASVLAQAKSLLAVGCFCIGTNQVDLARAGQNGVAVFNAPFSNTRSVAELAMAEIVMLARKATHKSMELHQGRWEKAAQRCFEVRQKSLGVVGYGHIGPQIGLLAEAFGMKVYFYDVVPKLALGNAIAVKSLDELLSLADFVTLHVPETAETKGMIAAPQLAKMKKGSYLLNLARGTVVDLHALREALVSGHLEGAALDVYPEEPISNDDPFHCELCGVPNVIMTPHIGGSTEEAQRNIGLEVAEALIKYLDTGSSGGAVNFPAVDLPLQRDTHRVLNIHRNVPGVLRDINRLVAESGGNIQAQFLATNQDIGYLIMDVDQSVSRSIKQNIDALEANIRTRLLF